MKTSNGDDAAFCQITLTSFYNYSQHSSRESLEGIFHGKSTTLVT